MMDGFCFAHSPEGGSKPPSSVPLWFPFYFPQFFLHEELIVPECRDLAKGLEEQLKCIVVPCWNNISIVRARHISRP